MSTEKNKALFRRWMEAWSTRDVSVLDALVPETFTPDFVIHDKAQPPAVMGHEGVKQFVRAALKNTPDIRITVEDILAEGDRLACRYEVSGTDAASSKPTRLLNLDIWRFADGKAAEAWGLDVPGEPQGS